MSGNIVYGALKDVTIMNLMNDQQAVFISNKRLCQDETKCIYSTDTSLLSSVSEEMET